MKVLYTTVVVMLVLDAFILGRIWPEPAASPSVSEEAAVAEVVAAAEVPEVAEEGCTAQLSSSWPAAIQQWKPLIEKWTSRYCMDANLIAAVMTMESGGKPRAVSGSGACGLMQVMARDTATVKPWLFRDRPTCAELKDGDFNIGWAVHYLATLYHHYGDSWREALFHYGPIDRGYSYADRAVALWKANQ